MKVFSSALAVGLVLIPVPLLAQELVNQPQEPEEVARLETIDYARSPVDNARLTLGEYAQLREELEPRLQPTVSAELRQLIMILRVRKLLKTVVPFAPF